MDGGNCHSRTWYIASKYRAAMLHDSVLDLLGSASGFGGGVHTVKMPEEEGSLWMGTEGPLVSDTSRV